MRGRRIAIASLVLCCAAGCRKEEPEGATAEPAAPSETLPAATGGAAPRVAPTHEHMQEHFDAIVRVRDELIEGNLTRARVHAQLIAQHEEDPAIASWAGSVASMRHAAAKVVEASEIGQAAAAAAELASACGHCHATHDVAPELGAAPPPELAPEGATASVSHMLRHQWAAERMWEGLIGPSDERWRSGADELAGTPLTSDAIFRDEEAAPSIAALAKQVHALGEKARAVPATASGTRSALYGELLGTCARCHQAIPSDRPVR